MGIETSRLFANIQNSEAHATSSSKQVQELYYIWNNEIRYTNWLEITYNKSPLFFKATEFQSIVFTVSEMKINQWIYLDDRYEVFEYCCTVGEILNPRQCILEQNPCPSSEDHLETALLGLLRICFHVLHSSNMSFPQVLPIVYCEYPCCSSKGFHFHKCLHP